MFGRRHLYILNYSVKKIIRVYVHPELYKLNLDITANSSKYPTENHFYLV